MAYENQNIKTANFFWGGSLTAYEISNMLSFYEKGFSVNVWSYENLSLPQEFTLKNAELILPYEQLNKFKQNFQKSNMSSFSNLFRYELLMKESGWWFDSDCICIKTAEEFVNLASDKPFVLGLENDNLVGSSVMYINDKEVVKFLLDEINQRISDNNYNFFWGEIGPYLITDVFIKNILFDKAINRSYFFSIEPENFYKLFNPKSRQYVEEQLINSFVCHSWNEMFRKFDISKEKLPPKNSYLYNHIKKFLPNNTSSVYGSLFNIRFLPIIKYFYKTSSRIKTLI